MSYSSVNQDLVCCLDAKLNSKSMAMKSLRKINAKLQLLYGQNEFLNSKLRRLLCNSLSQIYFDFTCTYFLVSFS